MLWKLTEVSHFPAQSVHNGVGGDGIRMRVCMRACVRACVRVCVCVCVCVLVLVPGWAWGLEGTVIRGEMPSRTCSVL